MWECNIDKFTAINLFKENGFNYAILDDIPGIGKTRKMALMKYFKSIEAIKAASVEELREVPSMNEEAAENVVKFFAKK